MSAIHIPSGVLIIFLGVILLSPRSSAENEDFEEMHDEEGVQWEGEDCQVQRAPGDIVKDEQVSVKKDISPSFLTLSLLSCGSLMFFRKFLVLVSFYYLYSYHPWQH